MTISFSYRDNKLGTPNIVISKMLLLFFFFKKLMQNYFTVFTYICINVQSNNYYVFENNKFQKLSCASFVSIKHLITINKF